MSEHKRTDPNYIKKYMKRRHERAKKEGVCIMCLKNDVEVSIRKDSEGTTKKIHSCCASCRKMMRERIEKR